MLSDLEKVRRLVESAHQKANLEQIESNRQRYRVRRLLRHLWEDAMRALRRPSR